jgi:hypothetical protein
MLDGAIFCSSSRNYSRHPWRSRYAPPSAFAFAVLQTQSRSDIRDPLRFALLLIVIPAQAGIQCLFVPTTCIKDTGFPLSRE